MIMTEHFLKTWPEYFQAVWDGTKTFEARKNDRDFKIGDTLILREFDPKTQEYSGRYIFKEVTYLISEPFAKDGHVIMALGDVDETPCLTKR